MKIYLTDTQQYVEFDLGKTQHDIQTLLVLKKIIPSVMELLLPILPDENQAQQKEITWESTSAEFELFKKVYQSWLTMELRLKTLERFKDIAFIKTLLINAQQHRQNLRQQAKYNNVELDYLFFLYLHSMIDAELVELGEPFYIPTFKQLWQKDMAHLKV